MKIINDSDLTHDQELIQRAQNFVESLASDFPVEIKPSERSAASIGFKNGCISERQEIVKWLKKYREAYGEDLFPTEDLSQFDPNIVTAVSGRMGRFILDNCIRDLEKT